MKTYCYENRYCPNAYSNEAFTIWGGGLSAWVLACFTFAYSINNFIKTSFVMHDFVCHIKVSKLFKILDTNKITEDNL